MSLSVIIPSQTLSNLLPCIEAVRKNEPDATILVIDDGLENRNFLQSDLGPIFCVNGDQPFIFSRNVNIGIKASSGDVVVLNDDALLQTKRGLSAMQHAAEEHPEFGLIGSTTNNVGNRNQQPQGIGLREDPRMVCFICVLIPRRTIQAVGMMDEGFTAYGYDDDDYCLRVRRAGLKIGIHDGCYVDHGSLKSTFRGDPKRSANLTDGRAIFVAKHGAHPL